jgi:branched-chain amino acid aminotransferase
VTPQLDGTLLPGITRDAVFTIGAELGLTVKQQPVARENLYTAQELFFCGTASEITPIRSVDRIPVGDGSVGPITRNIQKRFMDIVTGQTEDSYGWLTPTGS